MNQRKRPYFSLEFKQDAVQLVLSKGYSIPEAATSLGVSISALRKWVSMEKGAEKKGASTSGSQLSLNEREELLRLRKENNKLRMEREILKKAAADSTDHCNT
ncbi:transposase [Legionella quinlivanii]|nr:transposase [Legionella quinlivanii]STY49776.1 transposase [Legionella quinlivanii]